MTNNVETFDQTEVELRALQGQEAFTFKVEDLANPTGVGLLLQQRYVDLTELKFLKRDLEKLRGENLRVCSERETLRIEIAHLQERGRISLAEIIVGALLGYSLSIVTTNLFSGIILFAISVALLIIMKISQISETIRTISRKDQQNADR
jgi:hypothetical protein